VKEGDLVRTAWLAWRIKTVAPTLICVGVVLAASALRAQDVSFRVSRQRAAQVAAAHLGCNVADVAVGPLDMDCFPRRGPSWPAEARLADGAIVTVSIDAETGDVWAWRRFPANQLQTGLYDPPPTVKLSADQARNVAQAYARQAGMDVQTADWRPALATPQRTQFDYVFGWDQVVDPLSGTLGPTDLRVEVDFETGDVTGFYRQWQGPIRVATHPSLGFSDIQAVAPRFAILDPRLHPINCIQLRVAMDTFGVQRLVWECHQIVEDRGLDGVLAYTVVFDAHTGEPLYPIAPFGGSKHPMRTVAFPRRADVKIEPGGRAMATQLAPPVVNATGLWLRAEHLRAVEGVRVDVSGETVSVRLGDRVVSGTDLGARYRDYGWWVPLRQAARVLGWRVEWLNAKKEAAIYTR